MLVAALPIALLLAAPAESQTPPAAPLCGTRSTPPVTWDHVVWIWFENGYGAIVGSDPASHINRGAGRRHASRP